MVGSGGALSPVDEVQSQRNESDYTSPVMHPAALVSALTADDRAKQGPSSTELSTRSPTAPPSDPDNNNNNNNNDDNNNNNSATAAHVPASPSTIAAKPMLDINGVLEASLQNTVVMPVFQRILKALKTITEPRDKVIQSKVMLFLLLFLFCCCFGLCACLLYPSFFLICFSFFL